MGQEIGMASAVDDQQAEDVQAGIGHGSSFDQASLDQLIPAPMSRLRTFVVGGLILMGAVAAAFLLGGGYLVPQPTRGSSFGSDGALRIDREGGAFIGEVMMPNNSARDVRITAVDLDAPGAELVTVTARIENSTDGEGRGEDRVASLPLPITVPAGERAFIAVHFRPTDCDEASALVDAGSAGPPWGIATATVDFGDGAFPPLNASVRLDEDPIAEVGGSSLLTADQLLDGDHPLALACEVLR